MLSKTELVVLVIGSGLAAGVVQNAVAAFIAWRGRTHAKTEREAQESFATAQREADQRHQSTIRREQAHDSARATFLPLAQGVAAWADKTAHQKHWDEVGDFTRIDTNLPMPTGEVEVTDQLRTLMWGHPSASVRTQAQKLHDEVTAVWTEVHPDGSSDPDLDTVIGWVQEAQVLVEKIHVSEVPKSD